RSRPEHGRSRLPGSGAPASRRALQLRDVPDQAAARRGRPGPGDVSQGLPVLPPVSAGNPPPGLVVPNLEKHVPDVLPGSRTGGSGRGGWRPRLGPSDVSRCPGGRWGHDGGPHRPRAGHASLARGVPHGAPARRGRGFTARGGRPGHGVPGRDGEVADLQGEGAAPGSAPRLRDEMSERFDDTSDEMLGRRLAGELPRHTAPARLRVSIVDAATPRSRRPAWLMPMLSAAATAMVLVLAVMPVLPRIVPADPVQRYV